MMRLDTQFSGFLFFILTLFPFSAFAQDRPTDFQTPAAGSSTASIAVYADSGAWSEGIIAFEKFLDWKGLSHARVFRSEVNGSDLRVKYAAIYFPGGDAYSYHQAITTTGENHIRDLVNGGGAYIGVCAGAYFAAQTLYWEGNSYTYTLALFAGLARVRCTISNRGPDTQ